VAGPIVDIHPHIISTDTQRYPPSPLFGIRSDWSKERPASDEQLLDAMDEAGVAKTAIVHASTCYGFDNSYVADAVARFPRRCTGVGSIDMLAPDAAAVAKNWLARGITGLRIFTGGSTKKVDASTLDDPRSYPVWELMSKHGLSICVQTNPTGIPARSRSPNAFPRCRSFSTISVDPTPAAGRPMRPPRP
jgi:predicted TIM-barrel fold metal-dependent hydrolase